MNPKDRNITEEFKEYKEMSRKIRDEKRNKKFKKVKVFNITKNLIIILIIFLCAYLIFKEIKEYKDVFYTYNIIEQLDYMYNGDFTIISPVIDENSNITPNGIYIIKDNKDNIEFKAYKNENILDTDYAQYLYKKYVLEYIDENDIESIYYEDDKKETTTKSLYYFKFGMEINSFNDVENSVEQLISLFKFVNKEVSKHLDFEPVFYKIVIKLNDFEGHILQGITIYDSSYYITKIKTEYVEFLKNNNINDSEVTEEILETFYRPKDMKLVVDDIKCVNSVGGSTHDATINYDYMKKDYVTNFSNIIDKLSCIKEYKRENNGKLSYINYNDKVYYFDSIQEIKENKIPYSWTMKMIQDFFDVEIVYDYDNRTIYINTKQ